MSSSILRTSFVKVVEITAARKKSPVKSKARRFGAAADATIDGIATDSAAADCVAYVPSAKTIGLCAEGGITESCLVLALLT